MDLAALRRREATVGIEFDGERLRFTYNPHMYDDECQRILHRLSDQEDNSALSDMFERLITSWDLKDNGVEVPCTHEGFLSLPPFVRTAILNALVEDEMERGKLRPSQNTSNRTARSGLVPIGSSQSTTSNGSE